MLITFTELNWLAVSLVILAYYLLSVPCGSRPSSVEHGIAVSAMTVPRPRSSASASPQQFPASVTGSLPTRFRDALRTGAR